MKTQQTDPKRAVRWLSAVLLFGAILTMLFPAGAWAVGTAANTPVNNMATIDAPGYQTITRTVTVIANPLEIFLPLALREVSP